MRKLAVIAVTLCVAALLSQTPSAVAKDIPNQYGLEFRAGFSHYFMDDPNDFVDAYPTNYNITTTMGAPMLGISLLYKTHHNFGWNLGYNYIMKSSTKAEGPESVEFKIRGHELLVMGAFYWEVMSNLTLITGLGLDGFFGWLDREDEAGTGFNDATGRSLGFLANLGVEYPLKEKLGLKLGAGYRSAMVDNVAYRDSQDREHTVYYGNRPMELDFSGFYGQLGVCIYFDPATDWNKYGD
jgi:hypothetical protein